MRGHIKERSPGHFAIILDLQHTNGKRRRKWHSFKGTKRKAEIECARLISEMESGAYVEPAKTTVAHFFERWLNTSSQTSRRAPVNGMSKSQRKTSAR
jgi:hypothetical protein